MNYEIYQSEGSSRWNLRSINRNGKKKFIRGYATKEEAEFALGEKRKGVKRALV